MASLRHRREEEARMADDGHRDGTQDSTTAESFSSSSSSPAPFDLELHSMTAKGIKHLRSELLEINKASEEDFRRNVYLSYLSFLRLFEEAGDLEKDVGHLKRHVIAQRRLIQHLTDNLYSSILVAENNSKEEKIEATDASACDALDILLSEHRMDEALELLELQGQALEKMQNDGHSDSARLIASSMSALSARKARVADRFASLADNPRTPRHELLKALSGLCKLGDAQRANHLLFKFYRSSVIRHVEELRRCSKELSGERINYIKELAREVFSSILQASRSFVMLHGHPSSYTSELIRWAREEIEDFSIAFCEYAKSMSQVGETSLALALDAAKCALSYCSLLRPLKIVSEEDLIDLIVPCMEEVLAMYAKHLKEVVRLFVASDAWVLGRFLISGIIQRARSPTTSAAAGQQIEHCLLTTSGRKFVTLIQEVVEDVSPLLDLRMKNSALQLLAGLFREYMHSIVEVIPRKEGAFQSEARASNPDQQYMWQLSVLINCTTLVSLFPIIAHGIFKSSEASVLSVADFSTQRELDGLILFIKEAAGKVWTCFCQQFIRDTMSRLQTRPRTSFGEGIFAACLPSSPQGMMPSFAFQVLFLRVRQLNNLYGTILTGKDGTMKKLLQELMEAMISWLSNNLDYSWIHQAQNVPKNMLFDQIQLDVYFLLEFAQLGGFSSENIRTTALGLLRKAEEKVSSLEQDMNRCSATIREEGWATDTAKHAVQVLMGTELINRPGSQQEASVKIENALIAGEFDMARNGQEGEETGSQLDGSVASSGQKDMLDSNEHASSSVEPPMDETGACGCDGKSTDEFISIEDDRAVVEGSTEGEDDMSSESRVLDSENAEDKVTSNHKLLKDIPVDDVFVQRGGGDTVQVGEADGVPLPDTCCLSGLGGSEMCHAAIEATPCDPQDETSDHDSSCSFTTSPELLQDNTCSTPMAMVSDSAGEETGMPDECVADKTSASSTEGTTDEHSDPGSSSSRRRRQQANTTRCGRPAAADKQGTDASRKKREAMSRSGRPRWQ